MICLPHPQPSILSALPPEFILHLGPQSQTQVESLARVLKDLGAKVEIDSDGGLVATRPD